MQNRNCSNPKPLNGGRKCDGTTQQTCFVPDCESANGEMRNKDRCACGKTVTCPSNEFCASSANICFDAELNSCKNADGKNVNGDPCYCGSSVCAGGNTCTARSSKCALLDPCANNNGERVNAESCRCGPLNCVNGDTCLLAQKSVCAALPRCANVEGELGNTDACKCGTSFCGNDNFCVAKSSTCADLNSCTYEDGQLANKKSCKCGSTVCASGNVCVAESSICVLSTERKGDCERLRGQTAEYLDRHDIKCKKNEAINSFRVKGCRGQDMRYIFKCLQVPSLGAIKKRKSGCSSLKNEKMQYLDRQAVSCKKGEVLNWFGLTKKGCRGSALQYEYACAAVDDGLGPAVTRYSSCQPIVGKKAEWLDRAKPACKANEAMLSFRLTGCGGSNKQYQITCAPWIYAT